MQLIFVANMDADEVLRLLANVNATTDVQHRHIGGTTYVYQWSDNRQERRQPNIHFFFFSDFIFFFCLHICDVLLIVLCIAY